MSNNLPSKMRGGIGGIERSIQQQLTVQNQNIEESFKDLSNLIEKAKDMVKLSQVITEKVQNKIKNNEDDDEEIKNLRSCLLNMGIIDNPVTKNSSGSKYLKELALEINRVLKNVVRDMGGVMTLNDVYCRINRARGMAGFISPDDLVNACNELNKLNVELRYVFYKDTNLKCVQITELIENKERINEIYEIIEKNQYVSVDSLSKLLKCNTLVAKQLLLYGERIGKFCRDDTIYGLNFYINLFLLK